MKSADYEKDVICIHEFKFNSLHKFMRPVYAILDLNVHESDEKKQIILRGSISAFFKRMREYREITLEKMSDNLREQIEDLVQFEQGKTDSDNTNDIIRGYLKVCGGTEEFEIFDRQLREFKNPGTRQSQDAIAKDALKRFGIIMPGVDYKNLDAQKGIVLELKRPN